VPVMAIEHLVIFGFIEGLITSVAINYFLKNEPGIIYALNNGNKIENK